MSDPVGSKHSEDVLSSIRRLVTDGGRRHSGAGDRLVLTDALRVLPPKPSSGSVEDDSPAGVAQEDRSTRHPPDNGAAGAAGTAEDGCARDRVDRPEPANDAASRPSTETSQPADRPPAPAFDPEGSRPADLLRAGRTDSKGATRTFDDGNHKAHDPSVTDLAMKALPDLGALVRKEMVAALAGAAEQSEPSKAAGAGPRSDRPRAPGNKAPAGETPVDPEAANARRTADDESDAREASDASASAPAAQLTAAAKGSGAIDTDDLRPVVAALVREELKGALGERITRNVRKLVRREIHRVLMSGELD